MVTLSIVLVAVLLFNTAHSDPYEKVLYFPRTSKTDYVLLKPDFSQVRDKISVCAWVKKSGHNTAHEHWFSYATSSQKWEFTLAGYLENVQIFGGGYSNSNNLSTSLHSWHHCCATWSYTSQTFKTYLNGELEQAYRPSASRYLGTGGTLVIGQEQDSVGGSYDLAESFAGHLYQLNVFNKELTSDEVDSMFKNGRCSYLDHSLQDDVVISWGDILEGWKAGSVSIVDTGCEKWNWNWDALWELEELGYYLGPEATEKLVEHLKKNRPLY